VVKTSSQVARAKQAQTREEQTQPREPPAMSAEGRKGSRSLMHCQARGKRVTGRVPSSESFIPERGKAVQPGEGEMLLVWWPRLYAR